MPTVEIEGHTFNVDEDGFIDDFNNWNEAWVRHVKTTEGIEELTDEHWKVLNVLQDYYSKNGIARCPPALLARVRDVHPENLSSQLLSRRSERAGREAKPLAAD